ncbi:NADPH-dependent oxidoreductase [Glycomyces harbinensis]|uniref:Nitroreductase n=1 Tax=Glycomyces harbinensis TaxID=58114 RepID=A0A1G6V492_9ACTN|nr:NADPH-dependent oxidoreductase [Glycomyces harbinensis]SDD48283.1 Nitroreductase [Glycomyces harbinensis]
MADTATERLSGAAARYGDADATLDVANDVVRLQLAHRSVRRFTGRDVTDEELAALVAAAQSAPTSSNLQPWSVIAVRDPERKARLARLSASQDFVAQAPLFLVWIADLGRARRLAERAGTDVHAADYLETTLIGFIDTALAAQNAVVAAESLGLGSVFVGAIRNRPEAVAAELGLPPHTVAAFGLAVGEPDPAERADVKPRLPQEAVLHREQYDRASDDLIPVYDERLEAYNRRFGLKGTWTDRVLTRLKGPESMGGRHVLREVLERFGLPSR